MGVELHEKGRELVRHFPGRFFIQFFSIKTFFFQMGFVFIPPPPLPPFSTNIFPGDLRGRAEELIFGGRKISAKNRFFAILKLGLGGGEKEGFFWFLFP